MPARNYNKKVTAEQHATLQRLRFIQSQVEELQRERLRLVLKCWVLYVSAVRIGKAAGCGPDTIRRICVHQLRTPREYGRAPTFLNGKAQS